MHLTSFGLKHLREHDPTGPVFQRHRQRPRPGIDVDLAEELVAVARRFILDGRHLLEDDVDAERGVGLRRSECPGVKGPATNSQNGSKSRNSARSGW